MVNIILYSQDERLQGKGNSESIQETYYIFRQVNPGYAISRCLKVENVDLKGAFEIKGEFYQPKEDKYPKDLRHALDITVEWVSKNFDKNLASFDELKSFKVSVINGISKRLLTHGHHKEVERLFKENR